MDRTKLLIVVIMKSIREAPVLTELLAQVSDIYSMTKQLLMILYIRKNKNLIKSLFISQTFAKTLKQNLLKLKK